MRELTTTEQEKRMATEQIVLGAGQASKKRRVQVFEGRMTDEELYFIEDALMKIGTAQAEAICLKLYQFWEVPKETKSQAAPSASRKE